MNTFENKVALVTGASYGIGLAIAKELASRGAHLILAARSGEKLEALASSIRSEGGKAYTFNSDLSISGSADELLKKSPAKASKLTCLLIMLDMGGGVNSLNLKDLITQKCFI